MSGARGTLRFGALTVEVSRPDKVLYPDAGITKGQVIDYYRRVAKHALPFAAGRFLTLQRFPDGIGEAGFFQQARGDHFPSYIRGIEAERVEGGTVQHVVLDNAAGLAWLADQGTLTFHGWLSRQDRPDHPDRLVFDLDPASDDFRPVRRAALRLRELLGELGMTAYAMTTGSRGLHVVVPLDRSASFDEARGFAMALATRLARREADWLTCEQRREKRRGRLYLDVLRNAYGQTAVLPYSLRARAGAPVATPLAWHELERGSLGPRRYHLGNLFRRLAQIEDPWAGMHRHQAGIARAASRLHRMAGSRDQRAGTADRKSTEEPA